MERGILYTPVKKKGSVLFICGVFEKVYTIPPQTLAGSACQEFFWMAKGICELSVIYKGDAL